MSKRIEDFPIDEALVEEFIRSNKANWEEIPHNGNYIYINCSMVRMQVGWIIPKLLFAKGLQEKTGAKPIFITWRRNELITRLVESFGCLHMAIDDLCAKHPVGLLKASARVAGLFLAGGSGERIKEMKYKDILIGRCLYEDILRTSSLSTIRTVRNRVCCKKILHILWAIESLEKLHKKYPVQYAITDDMAYHEGIFIKLFWRLGARVFASSNVGESELLPDANGEIMRTPVLSRLRYEKLISEVTKEQALSAGRILEERFQGKNGKDLDRGAYADKKVYDRSELLEQLQVDESKKNVVIMAHTFTDAVFNYGSYYFRDYYDWLEKTLEIAEPVTTVNWILKPHPTRGAYNESVDSIEEMFARHHQSHMALLPDEVSAESIKHIADVILTIGGNAGAEFACLGIPAIIVGKPYYHGWGYTIEPGSFEEYKTTLEQIEALEPLSEQQIEMARKIFYLKNNEQVKTELPYTDELASLINQTYQAMIHKMAVNYFQNNAGTKAYNNQILQDITAYMKEHSLQSSNYYKKGIYRAEQL